MMFSPHPVGHRRTMANLTRSLLCFALLVMSISVVLAEVRTWRASENHQGEEGNADSGPNAFGLHGRLVLLGSVASNLVNDDENKVRDSFLADWRARDIERVSVGDDGKEANQGSGLAACSADGRFVAFGSDADNLVDGDDNQSRDIFVLDRENKLVTLISRSSAGEIGNSQSDGPSMSADGRFVAFRSHASNLVENDNNEYDDIFVRDLLNETTVRVSVHSDGTEGDLGAGENFQISANGRYVAFESLSATLVDRDRNGSSDIFVHDLQTRETERFLCGEDTECDGGSILPVISADGRFVAFTSGASNLGGDRNVTDVHRRDRVTGVTWLVSFSNKNKTLVKESSCRAISADGRFVLFSNRGNDVVEDDDNDVLDLFVRDMDAKTTKRVSLGDQSQQGNSDAYGGAISSNGRFVAFGSFADNLVENDTNQTQDTFVREYRTCADFTRGDSNCDETVNFDDIDSFVAALIAEGEYVLAHLSCDWQCNNDIDGDGNVDFNDIDGFVECLINNGCP